MGYIEELEKFVIRLQEKSKLLHKIYGNLPKGHLVVYKDNKYIRYVQSVYVNGKQIRKGVKKNKLLVNRLAYKEYLKAEIRLIDKDIDKIRKFIPKLDGAEPSHVHTFLPFNYDLLAPELFLRPEGRFMSPDFSGELPAKSLRDLAASDFSSFQREPYRANTKDMQNLKVLTSQGFYVRSKSEASIVDIYFKLGIPFHYDEVIELQGEFCPVHVSPDFIAIREDGTPVFHEHCGMMDNEDYVRNYYRKLNTYQNNGIVPWKNLIITYDTPDGGINLSLTEEEIKAKLIDYSHGSITI